MLKRIYLFTILITFFILGFSNSVASDWEIYYYKFQKNLESPNNTVFQINSMSDSLFSLIQAEPRDKIDSLLNQAVNDVINLHVLYNEYQRALNYAQIDSINKFNWYGEKSEDYIEALCNLAHIYDLLLMKGIAFSLFNRANSISLSVFGNSSPEYARALHQSSFFFEKLGYYTQSEDQLKTCISIFQNHFGKKDHEYLDAIHELAYIYRIHGRYFESEKLYLELLEVLQDSLGIDNWRFVFRYESQLAQLYSDMGRYDEEENLLMHFLKVAEERSDCNKKSVDAFTPLNNLVALYMRQGRYDEAISYSQRSLDLLQMHNYGDMGSISRIYDKMAKIFNTLGNFKLSEFLYDLTLDIRDNPIYAVKNYDLSSSLIGLSTLYFNTDRYNEAEKVIERALLLIENIYGKNNNFYYNGIKNLAYLYDNVGKNQDAEILYKDLINFNLEKIRNSFSSLTEKEKSQLIGTFREIFDRFYFFGIVNSSKIPSLLSEIYNYQLETKGIILSTTKKSREKLLRSKDSSLKQEYNTWIGLKNYLIELKNKSENNPDKYLDEIKRLEIDVYQKEKELSRKSADFSKDYLNKKTTWKDVQAKLKNKEAAIEIIRIRKYGIVPNEYNTKVQIHGFTDSIYYAALVITKETKKHPELILLKNGNEMEYGFIIQYNRAIKFEYEDKDSYDAFWSEIKHKLKGIKTIFISPDGVYNQINLRSILNPRTKKFIADEINIINVTNGKDIIETKDSRSSRSDSSKAEIFGDIYFDKKLPQLPGTRIEADKISKLLSERGYNVNEYLGEKATKSKLKSVNNPDILHISTHTYFKSKHNSYSGIQKEYSFANDPMLNSGLILSNDNDYLQDINTNNNIMTAYETAGLNLDKTECVVLSACQTGLGEVLVGEGIYGLQRAIKLAGAESIIMSLWKVNDNTTQELMVNYYKKYLIYHNKHRAFDESQKELRKKYPQPYYWGAFILVGG